MEKKCELLTKIIKKAYYEVPFYNYIYNQLDFECCDLQKFDNLPVISKDDVRQYGIVNFISQPYAKKLRNGKAESGHRIEFTSGTTSEPIEILWDDAEYFASVRHHWNERSKYNIRPNSRVLRAKEFKGNDSDKAYMIQDNIIYYNLKIHDTQAFCNLIRKINAFEPEWICMTASRIYLLLCMAEKFNFPLFPSVKFIEYIGEPLLLHYKEYIESRLHIQTTNMYGCTETNGIAYTCKHNNFHVMSKNVYVEVIENNEKKGYDIEGNICVTGYYNTKSPFIRYKLNDRGILKRSSECTCGNKDDILQLYLTRLPSVFIMDDESIYKDLSIYYEVFSLPNMWEGKKYNYFLLNLVSKNGLDTYCVTLQKNDEGDGNPEVEKCFKECMKAYGLEHLQLIFDYVDHIDYKQKKCGVFIKN